jgi:hypothetical protein
MLLFQKPLKAERFFEEEASCNKEGGNLFMGAGTKLKPDTTLADYWRDNYRFADLLNQVLFNGEDIIKPDKLTERDTDESTTVENTKEKLSVIRQRDVIKEYENDAEFILIGIENQTNIHYAMPLRTLIYDALRYVKQCKDLVNDYNLHLIMARDMKGFSFKNQDNRDFFDILGELSRKNGRINRKSFKEKFKNRDINWETVTAVGAAVKDFKMLDDAKEQRGGRKNMCTALDNWRLEGKLEGKAEGKLEAIKETIILLREMNIDEATILSKLLERFHITLEEAQSVMA